MMSHPASAGAALTRRRFVHGLALAGGALSLAPGRAAGAAPGVPYAAALSGTRFALSIGTLPVNLTGTPSTAITVNGALPGPILRWREGDTVTLDVTNRLEVASSIHWHGLRLPADMDGVPGLSFRGIAPGETFTYRFPVRQSGTYWYHSHSGFQDQQGLSGAIVISPRGTDPVRSDREHVVFLTDWTDSDPGTVMSNLKFQSDYYDRHQRTVGTFAADVGRHGLEATLQDRLMWDRMRMSPTDIADVTGATYSFLMNGQPPAANWTGLFRPGERVRLRFVNGSAMTFFDVRIPGLAMTVVAADGNDVEPVPVDEFRIGVAETYDVIVQPTGDRAYTVFAQSEARNGYARGTLAPRPGMQAAVPAMDPRPLRTMMDMGMATGGAGMAPMAAGSPTGTDMGRMNRAQTRGATPAADPAPPRTGPSVDNVARAPTHRLDDPGDGLDGSPRRVLTYADLRATRPGQDQRAPSREVLLHLTGNMARYVWGFDGRTFSQAEPIRLRLGERVRFRLINDTMMEHPIHLHGLWSELENGNGDYRPYKHTVVVKPGEALSYLVSADTAGHWAYHCHLAYHMDAGMFRTVIVA